METSLIPALHEEVYAHLRHKHPTLRFTLRRRSKGERELQKGYWFLGNNDYLTFSFWDAMEWSSREPAIALKIDAEKQELHLILSYYDADEKIKNFISEIAVILGMYEWRKNNWVKRIEGDKFLDALDKFIKTDKQIIDTFIKAKELSAFLPEINETQFIASTTKINEIRKKLNYKEAILTSKYEYASLRLKSAQIENLAMFKEEHRIDLSKNLTCLIGLNGSGKSTVLRSIALGLVGFEQSELIQVGTDDALKVSRMLRMYQNENMGIQFEKSGSIKIDYSFNSVEKNNEVLFKGNYRKATVSDNPDSDFSINFSEGADYYFNTLILAFPQEKGSEPFDDKGVSNDKPNINDVRAMITDSPDNRFKKVSKWLFGKYGEALNQASKRGVSIEQTDEFKSIELVFEVISSVTEEKVTLKDIKFDDDLELIWLQVGGHTQLMELISDGYSNLFGWVGAIVSRLYEIKKNATNSNYNTLTNIPAIVLIDEIDTYIHPQWQLNILAVLVETFPKIQFIVTTHSPYVVGSIPNDKMNLYICAKNNDSSSLEKFTEFTPYGADLDRLSTVLFGASTRVKQVRDALQIIEGIITNPSEDVVDEKYKRIKERGILPHFFAYLEAKNGSDNLEIAEKGIAELKEITSNDDDKLLYLESLIRTKRRLKAHLTR